MKKIKLLIQIIESVFDIPNINSLSRKAEYIEARALLYQILRNQLGLTYKEIGDIVNKTHATIINGYNSFPYLAVYKPELKNKLNFILKRWGYDTKNKQNNPQNEENTLKNLQERNKVLILSTQVLKNKLKMVVYHRHDCKYSTDDVEKIENFKTWSDRKKIDTLLHIDCNQYCNLGIDSSLKELQEVKTKSRIIYRTIKRIDEATGKLFLQSMD